MALIIALVSLALALYLMIGVAVSSGCTFRDERPSDHTWAVLIWPLILLYVITQVATGKGTFHRTNKGDRHGSSTRA